MPANIKLFPLYFAVFFLFPMSSLGEPLNSDSGTEIAKAKEHAMIVLNSLKTNLLKAMQEGGPGHAAAFCSLEAEAVRKQASQKLPGNVEIARVTDRPRNHKNKATEGEVEIMREYRAQLARGEELKPVVTSTNAGLDAGGKHFYFPIRIEAACLTCHGMTKVIPQNVENVLNEHYPNDKATGYALGDLRGLARVSVQPAAN